MTTSRKIQAAIFALIGLVFLCTGAYQWYELHQIEQGLKEGGLPVILLKIYEFAGKWGVAGFYALFSIYCFRRAYNIMKPKEYKSTEENKNQDD